MEDLNMTYLNSDFTKLKINTIMTCDVNGVEKLPTPTKLDTELNKQINNASEKLTKREKMVYTAIHLYIHLLFGLSLSSMAPAFVDFKNILNTDMQWIGLFPTFQAVGIFTGSFCPIIFKWVNRQLTLSCLVICMGLGTIFQPWAQELWQLYLCIFVYGFGIGAWNGSNNVILIEMWQNRSPSILQFSQFIYGVGTILGPLLDKNFVLGEMHCPGVRPEDCWNQTTSINTLENPSVFKTESDPCTHECLSYDRRPRLKIPFLIAGLLQMIGPAMFITMYIVKKYHYDKDSKIEVVINDEQKALHAKHVPSMTIIICISIFLAFGIMSENMYMDFAPTFYQYCSLKLTASEASELFSDIAIALTVGRGLSVFVAMYLKPQHMISYQSCIVLFGYIFIIFGEHKLGLLYASSIIVCFGYSSIFICLFSFVGQYMEVTDRIGGLFVGSYNAVYMFLPYFISKYVEEYPDIFLYVEIGSFSVACLSFITVMIAVRNVPKELIRKLGPIAAH